ncbi:hypothetical protein LbFV_ORF79 [Leptopilina boulardi filamentous virus]|uniref:Uncharacterized protein n=1 Tax=Leptopilina boulardi filamentous virus TaxID=552509 RepID=A0A1S5YD10_9VIRU|nr:hypothetical protein LbFV_ORF79 [Leptopilina boulardi filamentous virus]AQQ79999.1 hypothetical protein LbFV_ORF79 [Leptopilina boulardi filamentous virus]
MKILSSRVIISMLKIDTDQKNLFLSFLEYCENKLNVKNEKKIITYLKKYRRYKIESILSRFLIVKFKKDVAYKNSDYVTLKKKNELKEKQLCAIIDFLNVKMSFLQEQVDLIQYQIRLFYKNERQNNVTEVIEYLNNACSTLSSNFKKNADTKLNLLNNSVQYDEFEKYFIKCKQKRLHLYNLQSIHYPGLSLETISPLLSSNISNLNKNYVNENNNISYMLEKLYNRQIDVTLFLNSLTSLNEINIFYSIILNVMQYSEKKIFWQSNMLSKKIVEKISDGESEVLLFSKQSEIVINFYLTTLLLFLGE